MKESRESEEWDDEDGTENEGGMMGVAEDGGLFLSAKAVAERTGFPYQTLLAMRRDPELKERNLTPPMEYDRSHQRWNIRLREFEEWMSAFVAQILPAGRRDEADAPFRLKTSDVVTTVERRRNLALIASRLSCKTQEAMERILDANPETVALAVKGEALFVSPPTNAWRILKRVANGLGKNGSVQTVLDNFMRTGLPVELRMAWRENQYERTKRRESDAANRLNTSEQRGQGDTGEGMDVGETD